MDTSDIEIGMTNVGSERVPLTLPKDAESIAKLATAATSSTASTSSPSARITQDLLEYHDLVDMNRPITTQENIVQQEMCIDLDPMNLAKYPSSDCNRCRKTFAQMGLKPFKMCSHCRFLQRRRSRRWQKKTKEKDGVCRRCGTILSIEGPDARFVLCPHCRNILRRTKASRVRDGRCVHCAGPNLDGGAYKVCKRCRERDRIRRVQLEQEGACNRCAIKLERVDRSHKVCAPCRAKKKKSESDLLGLNVNNSHDLELIATSRSAPIVRNVPVEQLFVESTGKDDQFDILYDDHHNSNSNNNNNNKDTTQEQVTVDLDDESKYFKYSKIDSHNKATTDLESLIKSASSADDLTHEISLTSENPAGNKGRGPMKRPRSASPLLTISKASKSHDLSDHLLLDSVSMTTDHSQLNRQLSQFDIDNLMHYGSDDDNQNDPDESDMAAAVAAAISMSEHMN